MAPVHKMTELLENETLKSGPRNYHLSHLDPD